MAAEHYRNMAGTGRYIICENGAEIYDAVNKEELFTCALDKEFCKKMYEHVLSKKLFARLDI